MKVLVYGSGVIGSYLAHVLCGGDLTASTGAQRKLMRLSLKAQMPDWETVRKQYGMR